jgi:glycosyltransferase involved in cell wall biosynthesis
MEKLTCFAATDIVANSRSLADVYIANRLARQPKLRTVREGSSHGVDTDHFSPRPHTRDADEPLHIGFVGRLTHDKGIPALLDACTKLFTRGIEFKLHIVGPQDEPDSDDFLRSIRSQAFAVHVQSAIEDVRLAYSQMDVLVLPSLREGFPNVVLEAAAMAIPSVVSDATGCVDSVVDQVTGLVVPVGDPDALADALISLAHERGLLRTMGSSARQRAIQSFNPQRVVQGVLAPILADTRIETR